ncbi:hypothetical protein [Paracoccus marcusii]|uniref:hypothetical protein n=1 Tax=Paracoccus marcusii TaxID=59779 RepID=UPI002490FFF7|nr:hypothetical protein [Paracoccus marcusii]
MKIIAIGGSNTLLKGGYISRLEELMPEATIINRGIGATNCAMGLYRLMTCEGLGPGDIVLWEYALNDRLDKLRSKEWHLKVVEHTIRYAADKGAIVLPIILAHLKDDRAKAPSEYRLLLHFLAAAYGIRILDIPMVARNRFNVGYLPGSDFRDKSHYQPNGRVVELTAELVAEAIANGLRMARNVRPLYFQRGVIPVVRDSLIGKPKRNFTNKIINADYYDFRDGRVIFQPEIEGGRVLAGITLVSPRAGKCFVSTERQSLTMMMTPQTEHIEMVLLRAIFGGGWTASIKTDPGSFIKFEQPPTYLGDRGSPRGILGLLTEEMKT